MSRSDTKDLDNPALEEKLIDLEIRLTHQEDHIASLDKVIYEQEQMISALTSKIKQMDTKLTTMGEENILSSEEDVPPPHY